MAIKVREFSMADFDEADTFWPTTEGIVLRDTDTRDAAKRSRERNPDLSFVVSDGGPLAGTVLCGTDGRRGYLVHPAVAARLHLQGIGRRPTA